MSGEQRGDYIEGSSFRLPWINLISTPSDQDLRAFPSAGTAGKLVDPVWPANEQAIDQKQTM